VHFDTPVVEILHPALEALGSSCLTREVSKPDALHASGHDQAPPNEHEPLIIAGLGVPRRREHPQPESRRSNMRVGDDISPMELRVIDLTPLIGQQQSRVLSPRFTEALAVAAELHAAQRRKGSGVPYVSHVMAVTAIAFEYAATEDQAIAALLHDAIEDAPPAIGAAGVRQLILERFGADVLGIVEDCTDADSHPKPPWRPRKQAYISHVAAAVPGALLVSAADKLHNVRTILDDFRREGDLVWRRFSPDAGKSGTIGYYRGLVTAFRARAGDGTLSFLRLVNDLDAQVSALEILAGETGRWPPA
jgi:hypothetical protein